MNRFNQTTRFLVLILIGIFLFSCQKDDLEHSNKEDVNSIVSIELAKKVAQNYAYDEVFLNHPNKSKIKRPFRTSEFISTKKIKEILIIDDIENTPALYVVKFDPDGFVIVSASKKETPVLAFSETGNFEYDSNTSNEGLKYWIESRTERIHKLRVSSKETIPLDITHEWVVFSAPPIDDEIIVSGGTVHEQEGPLLTTTWNQGCGYNDLAPYSCSSGGACGKVWAGCTATATAQVMRYWESPSSYNWSIMPNHSGSYETSRLLRDIGDAVDMNWGCNGSGASLSNARDALVNTFGYSSYASLIDFNTHQAVMQLKFQKPFIMQGYDPSNSSVGHAWVCDGYRRNKYIWIHNPGTYYEHETYTYSPLYLWMNWGWGSFGNGWFLYNDFTPGAHNYNDNNKMIINIHS